MDRDLKLLGLALTAVLALAAMATPSAWAVDVFTVPSEDTTMSGFGGPAIISFAGSHDLECSHTFFEITIKKTGQSEVKTTKVKDTGQTPVPKETENPMCEWAPLGGATADFNGCEYVFTGNTTGSAEGKTDATMWIACPESKKIVFTNSMCTIEIPAQTPTSGGVSYTNGTGQNGKADITLIMTVSGLTYSTSGAFCALVGLPSEANNAGFTGTVTLEAPNGVSVS
jgi:hypothetical protein